MRPLWIVVLVVVAVLGITSVASASMRDEVSALVDTAVNLAADGEEIPDEPIPDESPAPDPADDDDGTVDDGDDAVDDGDDAVDDGDDGTVDDGDEADEDGSRAQNGHTWRWRVGDYRNHGEAVSEMAKCKDDTGQSHGAAVSAVARSQTGKPDKAAKTDKGGKPDK